VPEGRAPVAIAIGVGLGKGRVGPGAGEDGAIGKDLLLACALAIVSTCFFTPPPMLAAGADITDVLLAGRSSGK